jgi:hypothetical protein
MEIWLNDKEAQGVEDVITGKDIGEHEVPMFIDVNDELISTREISGIFTSKTMKTKERKRQGDWECSFGFWHTRGQECGHNLP